MATATASLERRVEALEQAHGGGECPRCSGTTVIFVNDELEGGNRNGRLFTPQEARTFVEEEENGRCPVCGRKREAIKVGGPGWGRS